MALLDRSDYGNHKHGQKGGDVPQTICLQGSQSGMETKVIGHIEREKAVDTCHLYGEIEGG